jgi:hypothetical protein
MEKRLHLSLEELEQQLEWITQAPRNGGRLELIVRRPSIDARESLLDATLDPEAGLVGDSWSRRKSSRTADGSPHPDMQLTLMCVRVIAGLAGEREHWPLAGDQLYVDMDLSAENLPPKTRLEIGQAVVEITEIPHTGCQKFMERFGQDALRFVSTPAGKELRLRGVYAKVIRAGAIRVGDVVKILSNPSLPQGGE